MAQLSRGRALHLVAIAVAVGSIVAAGATPARSEVNLTGTWYVLVHYKDGVSANPEMPRWEDRLWSFEPSGSRLRWTDWPIVVFSSDAGRFERRASGQYARVLDYWEPDPGQFENIRSGLSVNDRGSKEKTLRKVGDDWRSSGRARAVSAMSITYQENWIIESPGGLPAFIREDMLGAANAESVEGRTEYRTQEIQANGDILVGTYERDGTRHGTFRMMRAGERKHLEEKSQKELQQKAWRREAASSQFAREEVRNGIEKALEARGVSVGEDRLDELVDEWLRLYQSGARENEINAQVIGKALREAGDAP